MSVVGNKNNNSWGDRDCAAMGRWRQNNASQHSRTTLRHFDIWIGASDVGGEESGGRGDEGLSG